MRWFGKTADQDRRRAPRQSNGENGVILLGFAASVSCTVIDISRLGACLEVEPSTDLSTIPSQFSLFVGSRQMMHACRVVWKSFQRVGVQFS